MDALKSFITESAFICALSLFIYNVAIILFTLKFMSVASLKSVVSEKDPDTINARTAAATAAAARVQAGAAAAAADIPEPVPDSYSRVTGMFGLVIMACFLWGLGNAALYKLFLTPGQIKELFDGVGTYFLSGTALFAPYAFNQIKETFKA